MLPLGEVTSIEKASVNSGLVGETKGTSIANPRSPIVPFILIFLLLYGPRPYESFPLDMISLVSLGIIIYSLFFQPRIKWVYGSTIPLIVLYCLFLYSSFITLSHPFSELFYPLKFARAAITYWAVYIICFWYRQRYGPLFIFLILEQLFWAIALHGVIMITQYINPEIDQFVRQLSGSSNPSYYRATGLTISYNTLAIVQGFGLLTAMTVQNRFQKDWKHLLFLPATTVIFISMFLAGRTTAYITLFFSAVALLTGWRKYLVNRNFIFMIIGVSILLSGLRQWVSDDVWNRFDTVTLHHLIDPIESYIESGTVIGTYGGDTAYYIFYQMYFLPNDPVTLLFGSSLSGRGDVYISSDAGYILFIFGIGLLGTAVVVIFYLYQLIIGFRWYRYDPWLTFLSITLTVAILVLHFKEQTLFTRHAFTLSSILLCSWYLTSNTTPRETRLGTYS